MPIHANLASGKWQTLSFAEQMGNIGSEVSRARAASNRGDIERRNRAIERVLELVDLTLRHENRQPHKRELGLFRDVITRAREDQAGASLEMIERYCLPFGIVARKHV